MSADPQADRLATLADLLEVAAAARASVTRVLEGVGLTDASTGLLWALGTDPEEPTMHALADRLRCDRSNVTLLVNRLGERGLVERVPHARDGRMRVVRLTRAGRALWAEVQQDLTSSSPLAALPGTDLDALARILRACR